MQKCFSLCDMQSAKWPPMISTSWYWQPWVVSSFWVTYFWKREYGNIEGVSMIRLHKTSVLLVHSLSLYLSLSLFNEASCHVREERAGRDWGNFQFIACKGLRPWETDSYQQPRQWAWVQIVSQLSFQRRPLAIILIWDTMEQRIWLSQACFATETVT